MKIIGFRIGLEQPALVTKVEGDPNSAVAFDYLPGSVLRGALIARFMRETDNQFDTHDATIRRLFFNGQTRFLNGYPVSGDRPTLPVPKSWRTEKERPEAGYDLTYGKPDNDLTNGKSETSQQLQRIKVPFYAGVDPEVRLVEPERYIDVHTARERGGGRPTANEGAVYRYEALAADQVFEAAIMCDFDFDGDFLESLLSGTVYIGGSRSAGYGRARLEPVSNSYLEETIIVDQQALAKKLVISFLSDTVLRDQYGQCSTDSRLVGDVIGEGLGLKAGQLVPEATFSAMTVVGGFNRKWGLPLPQTQAIEMGSVYVFSCPQLQPEEVNRLKSLVEQGIGERRVEGFGRFSVSRWPRARFDIVKEDSSRTLSSGPVELRPDTLSGELAQRMVDRLFQQQLDRHLLARANTIRLDRDHMPHRSQLSRLRTIISNELLKQEPDMNRVRQFLATVERRQNARTQFERAWVIDMQSNQRDKLLTWLNNKLMQPYQPGQWQELFDLSVSDIRTVGGIEPAQSETLWHRQVLRLIDEVLAHAIKDSQKRRA